MSGFRLEMVPTKLTGVPPGALSSAPSFLIFAASTLSSVRLTPSTWTWSPILNAESPTDAFCLSRNIVELSVTTRRPATRSSPPAIASIAPRSDTSAPRSSPRASAAVWP